MRRCSTSFFLPWSCLGCAESPVCGPHHWTALGASRLVKQREQSNEARAKEYLCASGSGSCGLSRGEVKIEKEVGETKEKRAKRGDGMSSHCHEQTHFWVCSVFMLVRNREVWVAGLHHLLFSVPPQGSAYPLQVWRVERSFCSRSNCEDWKRMPRPWALCAVSNDLKWKSGRIVLISEVVSQKPGMSWVPLKGIRPSLHRWIWLYFSLQWQNLFISFPLHHPGLWPPGMFIL